MGNKCLRQRNRRLRYFRLLSVQHYIITTQSICVYETDELEICIRGFVNKECEFKLSNWKLLREERYLVHLALYNYIRLSYNSNEVNNRQSFR